MVQLIRSPGTRCGVHHVTARTRGDVRTRTPVSRAGTVRPDGSTRE
ncbi:hypothetical protein F750_1601 [Streptomyces sp. PAMC 26508]|nr:hypothetical protein F750_1601 [Streptomyces sp. PAMC 26508]